MIHIQKAPDGAFCILTHFRRNGSFVIHSNHADIIQTFTSSKNYPAYGIIFERNYIKDNGGQFGNLTRDLPGIQDWTFRNNVFVNSRIQLNIYIPDVKIYNNIVYGTPAASSVGFRFTGAADRDYARNGHVFNNIFIGDGGFYSFNTELTGTSADYNIIANLDGSARITPKEGSHGINGGFNPENIFVDIASGDFRLKTGSLAINAGANLNATGFNADFINTPRPQGSAWDIGAYEYVSGGTPSPPPPSTFSLSVLKTGTGSGTVTGTGINCGVDCSETVSSGTAITLTATPASGSTFSGWSGGGCSGIGSCTVIVSSNVTVIATFTVAPDAISPTVSITVPTSGSTVSGSVPVSATASDNVAVIGVQFKLDGINLGAELTTLPYSGSWNTIGVSNGTHTLTAVARDAAGNITTSAGVMVTVSNIPADTTPPVISSIASGSITSNSVNITWNTNELSDTQVEYGLTTSYGDSTAINTTLTTNHSASLINLSPSTTYHLRVKSKDVAGNLAVSADQIFTTGPASGPVDITPPVISAITASNITATSTTINWTTNEPATSRVNYGLTTSYGAQVSDTTFTTSHRFVLPNLTRKKTYHYNVSSTDASGNISTSLDQTFTTANRFPKPPRITIISATLGSVVLSWTNPDYEYLNQIAITRRTDTYSPTLDPAATVATLSPTTTSWHDTTVVNGTTYYYSLFTIDDLGVVSDPIFVTYTPQAPIPGVTPPVSSGGGGGGGRNISPVGAFTPTVLQLPATPALIPGCDNRTTGFSVTTGQSCVGNIPASSSGTLGPSVYNFGAVTLRNGSRGEAVKELQRFLNARLNLGLVVDGKLGPKTIAVIKQWQKDNGLVPDGLVGAKTKARMNGR